jgi:regulator of CtrA degradation
MAETPRDKTNMAKANVTVDFGERFASSDLFNKVFREGMALVEETASYLDGPGRRDSRDLPRPVSISYATESMRLTTRLMQLASWLLLQRAVKEGEMSAKEAAEDKYRINLSSLKSGEKLQIEEGLPDGLVDLIHRSHRLLDRIKRLDQMLSGEGANSSSERNVVNDQVNQLAAAFERPGKKPKH